MGHKFHAVGPAKGIEHTHTVILLHGRDSECQEFAEEFFESEASHPAGQPRTLRDLFPSFKWVFPGASTIHSERFNSPLSQWFDMWSLENPDERPELQQPGLSDSIEFILGIIEHESTYVNRNRIYLGGISQGFVTAVATFFSGGGGFAGLIGQCSWAPPALASVMQRNDASLHRTFQYLQEAFTPELHTSSKSPELRTTPILLSHSIDDDVVPVNNGRVLRDSLRHVLGTEVEWREYEDGGHWFDEPLGIDDIAGFFRRTV